MKQAEKILLRNSNILDLLPRQKKIDIKKQGRVKQFTTFDNANNEKICTITTINDSNKKKKKRKRVHPDYQTIQ